MSSISGIFKRSRSKSEKGPTPPKVTYRDLNSAYASIGKKSSPGTPISKGLESPAGALQSPDSETSPSLPLLSRTSPERVRMSRLSGDLFLPENFDTKSNVKPVGDTDESPSNGHDQGEVVASQLERPISDQYLDTSSLADNHAAREPQTTMPQTSASLNSAELPALSQVHSNLSGMDLANPREGQVRDRCETIQSLSSRHEYGRVQTNEDIRSLYGAESVAEDKDGQEESASTIQEVDWSPRPSSELNVLTQASLRGPPPTLLPRTPKGKGKEVEKMSSPSEGISQSPESYGNTQKLLELSLPRFDQSRHDGHDFFRSLLEFTKEGQASSSKATSTKSYATLSIGGANGEVFSRPVSQGQVTEIHEAMQSHMRGHHSQVEMSDPENRFVHVGQISLSFSQQENYDGYGVPSLRTRPSETERNWATEGSLRDPIRTRNGTPPLLFGKFGGGARHETDWETIEGSNDMTSSIADYSDSASRSPPKGSLLMGADKVLEYPAHPRYNHSWDLQQDITSGRYVLTPNHAAQHPGHPYRHPRALTTQHSHPLGSTRPTLAPSQSAFSPQASVNQQKPFDDSDLACVTSQRSSTWRTTSAGSITTKLRNSLTAPRVPPLPTRNPLRKFQKQTLESEPFELQEIGKKKGKKRVMDATMASKHEGKDEAEVSTISTMASGVEGPSSRPHRRNEGHGGEFRVRGTNFNLVLPPTRRLQNRASDEEALLNPFSDPVSPPALARTAGNTTTTMPSFAPAATDDVFGTTSSPLTPPHRTLVAGSPGTPSRGARINTPGDLEAGLNHQRRRQRFVPLPHPLVGTSEMARLESPHMFNVPRGAVSGAVESERWFLSRRYLAACACLPFLLPLFQVGALDFLMRLHSGGLCRGFSKEAKAWAGIVFLAEAIFVACVVVVALVVR